MKKVLVSLPLICFITFWGKTDKNSQTFLFTRPAYQNISSNQAGWHSSLFDINKHTAAQAHITYQESYKSDHIKEYFLLPDRTHVKFNSTAVDRDVLPEWFALPTNFNGLMTVAPTQKQINATFEFRKDLGPLLNISVFKDWWITAATAVLHVENNLNLTQSNLQNTAASTLNVYDIVTAYNNPDWKYLKSNGHTKDTHIAHIQIAFGTTVLSTPFAYASSYSGISIPTHKKITNKTMFEAQAGYNGHVGIIWGLNLQAPLTNENAHLQTLFVINLENNFLIRNHQYRTFDLKEKPWSRYITMRKKDQTTDITTPGVNVLTHIARVSPHALVDFSSGIRFSYKAIELDLGYGLWAHGGETIKLTTPFKEEYGIAGTTTNTSASGSTIKTRASNDATFTVIKESDINLSSGAMLPSLIHKIYINLGCKQRGIKADFHTTVGGFVEIPRNTTKGLATWGISAKAGGAF